MIRQASASTRAASSRIFGVHQVIGSIVVDQTELNQADQFPGAAALMSSRSARQSWGSFRRIRLTASGARETVCCRTVHRIPWFVAFLGD